MCFGQICEKHRRRIFFPIQLAIQSYCFCMKLESRIVFSNPCCIEYHRWKHNRSYLDPLTLVISYMILIQMGHIFLFGNAISETGSIIKENVHLGWATSNPLGSILVGLIPMLFYGAMKSRHGLLYLLTALLVYAGVISTCSRNALLFGTMMLVVCIAAACLKSGKRRRMFIVTLLLGAASCSFGSSPGSQHC